MLHTKQTLIKHKQTIAPTKQNHDVLFEQLKRFQKLILKFIVSANLNPDDDNVIVLTNEEQEEPSILYKYTIKRSSLEGYFRSTKDGKKMTYTIDFSNPSLIYNKRTIVNDLEKIKEEIIRFQKAVTAYTNGQATFYSITPQ